MRAGRVSPRSSLEVHTIVAAAGASAPEQVLEQVEQRRLRPVDVIDDATPRAPLREDLDETSDAPEQLRQGESRGCHSGRRGQALDDLVVANQLIEP